MDHPRLDTTDRDIINALQGGFPICDEPFKRAAGRLGISEAELIVRITRMLRERTLSRFGPMFQAERLGGAFVLAAALARVVESGGKSVIGTDAALL